MIFLILIHNYDSLMTNNTMAKHRYNIDQINTVDEL